MNARFAGSRTLDERRRRWLATHEADNASPPSSRKSAPSQEAEPAPAERKLTHFPLRKLISPKPWKIVLVGMMTFLVGAGLLAVGAVYHNPRILGPGWSRVMDANGGRLARMYQAGLLFLSGQSAMLIWWARSQSLRDFAGTYHVWLWGGLSALFAAGCLAGDWHWAWSDSICWLWSARFPQREVLCWMLPALLVGSILWRKLRADMRRCASSSILIWLAAAATLAACIFRLGIDRTGWPIAARQFIGACLQMLASTSLFVGFLAHVRFVIHVSAEPPEAGPSVGAKLLKALQSLWANRPRLSLKFWTEWKQAAAEKAQARAKLKADKKEQKLAQKAARQKQKLAQKAAKASPPAPAKTSQPTPAKEPAKPQAEATSAKETKPQPPAAKPAGPKATPKTPEPTADNRNTSPAKEPASAAKPAKPPAESEGDDNSAKEPQLRVDQPLDPEMLKGLSKKERRRLRKQHRDAQRKS